MYFLPFLLFTTLTFSSFAEDEGDYGSWSGQGETALEWRRFQSDENNLSEEVGLSIFSRVEATYEDEVFKHVFRGFGRIDQNDEDRGLIVIEDAYLSGLFGSEESWRFFIGYKLFNWTATEAFHPADVVNSRNFDSDLENLEKKGELTLEIEKSFESTTLSFYLFPRFEPPEFPGFRSRLGSGVSLGRPVKVNGTETGGQFAAQYGFRFNTTYENLDLSFHFIQHIDRDIPIIGTRDFAFNPTLGQVAPVNLQNPLANLTPFYFNVQQIGLTATLAIDGFIFKLEAAQRDFEEDLSIFSIAEQDLRTPVDHQEVAVGFEYGFAHDNGTETTFFFEGNAILGVDEQTRTELDIFQRDVFLGIRYALNDAQGSEFFASIIHDIERQNERLYNLSYARRLNDEWKVRGGVRVFDAPIKGSQARGLEAFDNDSYVYLRLSRFF